MSTSMQIQTLTIGRHGVDQIVWGYQDMLEILKDPKHEEYEYYNEWLGGDFDPEEFDVDEVNSCFERTADNG